MSTSNLQAVDGAEQAEGHMLPPRLPDADDVEDGTRRVTPGALNGQESLPAVPKDAPDGQVSSNSTAETQEQGLPEVPAVVAATDARNGTGPSQAAKEEQSAVAAKGENEGEEKDSSGSADGGVMPELQGVMDDIFPSEGREGAGEQKAAVEEEEEEAEPRPNVRTLFHASALLPRNLMFHSPLPRDVFRSDISCDPYCMFRADIISVTICCAVLSRSLVKKIPRIPIFQTCWPDCAVCNFRKYLRS